VTDPSTLSDTDLLARFHEVEWEIGEPEHEALIEQVRIRNLDF
jgi:hypothetical protein